MTNTQLHHGFFARVTADVAANHKSGRCSAASALACLAFSSGFQLLLLHRIQHGLLKLTPVGKLLAKLLFIITKWLYPCDINPYARIAGGVRIPHAVGIIIARDAVIERGVTLYQHITIGQRTEDVAEAPVVQEGAVIYAGAVLGGAITIGKGAVIGANAVVMQSVPNDYLAVGIPAQLRPKRG
jgi:serine O-acetyltransferase